MDRQYFCSFRVVYACHKSGDYSTVPAHGSFSPRQLDRERDLKNDKTMNDKQSNKYVVPWYFKFNNRYKQTSVFRIEILPFFVYARNKFSQDGRHYNYRSFYLEFFGFGVELIRNYVKMKK